MLTPPAGAVNVECAQDSDCTQAKHGQCVVIGNNPYAGFFDGDPEVVCRYGCVDDTECGPGSVCVCGHYIGMCAPASCTTDADCPDSRCAVTRTQSAACAPSGTSVACQKPTDECQSANDCRVAGLGNACQMVDGIRKCAGLGECGRPFLVDGVARVAAHEVGRSQRFERGAPWSSDARPNVSALAASARQRLADHWTSIALMEHASVAAFARFTLELMSLGCPAALVSAAQGAMGDEIEHARACFALASAYRGQAVEPKALALSGALDDSSPRAIATRAFLEACLGETIAAVEARAQLEHATNPTVREVLTKIATDEARHAELGWRFLAWFLSTQSPAERVHLERALRAQLQAVAKEVREMTAYAGARPTLASALRAHGLLDDATRREARLAAIAEVCGPCLEALFRTAPSSPLLSSALA